MAKVTLVAKGRSEPLHLGGCGELKERLPDMVGDVDCCFSCHQSRGKEGDTDHVHEVKLDCGRDIYVVCCELAAYFDLVSYEGVPIPPDERSRAIALVERCQNEERRSYHWDDES